MHDDLLSATGPEGRNQDAARFERQLIAMGRDVGWRLVEFNFDVFTGKSKQAAGLDILWSLETPRDGRREGWLGEGKRHDGPGRYTPTLLGAEVGRLREKIARLDRDS